MKQQNNDRSKQKTFTCKIHNGRVSTSAVDDEQFAARICRDCWAEQKAAEPLPAQTTSQEVVKELVKEAEEQPVAKPEIVQPQPVVKEKTVNTKRAYHLVYGYSRLDKAWKYDVLRQIQEGEEFKAKRTFRVDQCSNFLERNMPSRYIQCTWPLVPEGITAAKNTVMRGINQDTIPGYLQVPMHLWWGYVGENIQATFTPYQIPMARIGLAIATDCKVKYPKRVFAPHIRDMQGQYKAITEDLFEFVFEGPHGPIKLTGLVREANKANDGMSLCTPRAAHLISGEEGWEEGDAFRFTGLFDKHMVKGHIMVKEDLAVDMIFFGPKKGMYFDKVWLATMGELHAARTKRFDFQSIVDFFQHNGGTEILEKIAEDTMKERLAMTEDSDAMRRMLLNMHDLDEESDWVLIEALKRDIDAVFPGLWRRLAKTFMPEIDKMGIGRIGADTHLSDGYCLRFPDSFDREGNDVPTNARVRGNFVFSPQVNVDQDVVLYRQPNGNPAEHWKTKSVHAPHWKGMGRGNVIYFAYEMAEPALGAMGGGDFDDRIMIVKNPDLVKIFDRLPEYPIVKVNQE